MNLRKRAFTLLEVLIAMVLTAGLLSFMLGVYLDAERSSAWWRSQEEKLLPERFMQRRLEDIFRHLIEPDQKTSFFFATDSSPGLFLPGTPSLIFSYNNGIVNDSNLSEDVLGRLFVDNNGQMTLITWPERSIWNLPGLQPFHREVLLSHVTDFKLSFVRAPDPLNDDEGGTSFEWTRERKELPMVIKMNVKANDNPVREYLFPVPQTLAIVDQQ